MKKNYYLFFFFIILLLPFTGMANFFVKGNSVVVAKSDIIFHEKTNTFESEITEFKPTLHLQDILQTIETVNKVSLSNLIVQNAFGIKLFSKLGLTFQLMPIFYKPNQQLPLCPPPIMLA